MTDENYRGGTHLDDIRPQQLALTASLLKLPFPPFRVRLETGAGHPPPLVVVSGARAGERRSRRHLELPDHVGDGHIARHIRELDIDKLRHVERACFAGRY